MTFDKVEKCNLFPRVPATRPWLGELLLKKVYLTMWRIQIFKKGPRVVKAEEKRGNGGGLGLQFGLPPPPHSCAPTP